MAWKYKSLRHPHTYQERRQNDKMYGEDRASSEYRFSRGKRRRIPTEYDDIHIHQWKWGKK